MYHIVFIVPAVTACSQNSLFHVTEISSYQYIKYGFQIAASQLIFQTQLQVELGIITTEYNTVLPAAHFNLVRTA